MREFVLTDDAGNKHTYSTTHLPASDGLPLARKLYAAGAGPLAALVSSVLKPGGGSAGEAAAELSKEKIVTSLLEHLPTLIEAFDQAFFYKLFLTTRRDGEEIHTVAGFNAAFTGNYGELIFAAVEVIQHNGFFPLSRLGGKVSLTNKALPAA